MNIKVLLVDDHAVMRMGLAALLGTVPDITVVGEADDGRTALELARELEPDVIVMDLLMPGMDGNETTRRVLADNPGMKILILTTYGTADALGHALDTGALGAIIKNADLVELLTAIRTVAGGKRYIAPEIEQMISDEPPLPELSKRQAEILDGIIRNLSNEEISMMLDISVPMVKEHTKALYTKIGAANRADAVAIAMRKHLLMT